MKNRADKQTIHRIAQENGLKLKDGIKDYENYMESILKFISNEK